MLVKVVFPQPCQIMSTRDVAVKQNKLNVSTTYNKDVTCGAEIPINSGLVDLPRCRCNIVFTYKKVGR